MEKMNTHLPKMESLHLNMFTKAGKIWRSNSKSRLIDKKAPIARVSYDITRRNY